MKSGTTRTQFYCIKNCGEDASYVKSVKGFGACTKKHATPSLLFYEV